MENNKNTNINQNVLIYFQNKEKKINVKKQYETVINFFKTYIKFQNYSDEIIDEINELDIALYNILEYSDEELGETIYKYFLKIIISEIKHKDFEQALETYHSIYTYLKRKYHIVDIDAKKLVKIKK